MTKYKNLTTILTAFAWVLLFAWSVPAFEIAIPIDPSLVNGSGGGNYAGDLTKLTDGSGMNGNGDNGPAGWPAGEGLPSTWTATSNRYQAEWQSDGNGTGILNSATSINGKIGWLTFDLGQSYNLKNLYFWQCRQNNSARTRDFNIYFADAVLNLPAIPSTNASVFDYAFSGANGWTIFGDTDLDPSTGEYTMGDQLAGPNDIISAIGNSARYIGLEVLTNDGSTTRIGLAEFAVTIPEPGSFGLLAVIGSLVICLRRFRN